MISLIDGVPNITQMNLSVKQKGIPRLAQWIKNTSAMQETQEMHVQSLGCKDPIEKEMAPHSCILVWKIPWTEKPGRLWSIGLQRVGRDESD